MATKLALMVADFETSLATKLEAGAATCSIQSNVDDDGVTLPNGVYFFTIDRGNSQKEHIVATLTGTSLSGIKSISRQGVQTANAVREHRIGASVGMTDFAHIMYINNILRAVDPLDSNDPLAYDVDRDALTDLELVTKGELARTALGTLTNNRLIVQGNAGETVAAGNLLYLDTADTEWKKCDADTAATVNNVQLGIAQGAGTDGNAITGGVLLRGIDTHQSGLSTNTIYYASNTAGAISATPGTTEVTIGSSLSATELYFDPRFNQMITENEQDALAGTSGTPSATNKYVTADDVSAAGVADKIVRATGSALPALSGANLTNIGKPFYGDGAQGALSATGATTINSTITTVDASSASGQAVLNVAATTGIVAGDHIFIHQSQGTGAGLWEIGKVLSVDAGNSFTLTANLKNSYAATGAQVILIPEYTTVDFKTGATIADAAWDGSKGGIVILYSSQGVIIENGVTISVASKGFRGGGGSTQGESEDGTGTNSQAANGMGGGNGGNGGFPGNGGLSFIDANSDFRTGGFMYKMIFGGGGGGTFDSSNAGEGGGILIIIAPWIWNAGTVSANGGDGAPNTNSSGGSGAGGWIAFFAEQIFNTTTPTVAGGATISDPGGSTNGGGGGGGNATAGANASGGGGGAGGSGMYIFGYPVEYLPQS